MDFYIGADPEMFLVDQAGNFKSGVGVVAGTKHDQLMVDGGGLQYDNVAVEFSCDPQDSEEKFVAVIKKMLGHLHNEVAPLKLLAVASNTFPQSELQCEEAQQFGCEPDFDAYQLCVNEMDPTVAGEDFRSCGGHIHIGHKDGYPKILAEDEYGMGKVEVVKAMDFFVGIPSVILDKDPSAVARRNLYGKAGAHRPKDYGVEYRAVGNFWLRNPEVTRLAYRLTALAVKAADEGVHTAYIQEVGPDSIQAIINESRTDQAKEVFEKYIRKHLKPETQEMFDTLCAAPFTAELTGPWGL